LMEAGDKLVVTFSETLATPANGTPAVTETDPNGGGNDTLTIAGVTTASNTGTDGYLTSNNRSATFSTSARSVSGATITVTVAGACSGSGCGSLAADQGALVFVPLATVTDAAGNAAAGSFTTAATFRLF
jgi:hypothetical protein